MTNPDHKDVLIHYIRKISKLYDLAGGIGGNDADWAALGQAIVDALEYIRCYIEPEREKK